MSDIDTYQAAAMRTAADLDDPGFIALCLAGEVGELANKVKKVIGHGHDLEPESLAEECGDVLWYLAIFAERVLAMRLSTIAELNIDKLAKRYPDGFSEEASRNRSSESSRRANGFVEAAGICRAWAGEAATDE